MLSSTVYGQAISSVDHHCKSSNHSQLNSGYQVSQLYSTYIYEKLTSVDYNCKSSTDGKLNSNYHVTQSHIGMIQNYLLNQCFSIMDNSTLNIKCLSSIMVSYHVLTNTASLHIMASSTQNIKCLSQI